MEREGRDEGRRSQKIKFQTQVFWRNEMEVSEFREHFIFRNIV